VFHARFIPLRVRFGEGGDRARGMFTAVGGSVPVVARHRGGDDALARRRRTGAESSCSSVSPSSPSPFGVAGAVVVRRGDATRASAHRRDPFDELFDEVTRGMEESFDAATRGMGFGRASDYATPTPAARARARRRSAERIENARRLAPRDAYEREERGEQLLPGGGVHRYYVSERVTTFDGRRRVPEVVAYGASPASRFLSLALTVAGLTAYAALGNKFAKGFDATTFKSDAKTRIVLAWPFLWVSSAKFRSAFDAALDASSANRPTHHPSRDDDTTNPSSSSSSSSSSSTHDR